MSDMTDIFGEFSIWIWGKTIPSDVDKCQEFMRKSPLGKEIEELQKKIVQQKETINKLIGKLRKESK